MNNVAALNDEVHYRDPITHARLAIYVVALNLDYEHGKPPVNGVAVPVDEPGLEALDERELHYERIDVTAAFSPNLDRPVWTYVADPRGRADFETGQRLGQAFISRDYHERVTAGFREMGNEAWRQFVDSTDPPQSPLRDLLHTQVTTDGKWQPR